MKFIDDRWGGPLPQSWLDDQLALQKKILTRMYDFGMTPGNKVILAHSLLQHYLLNDKNRHYGFHIFYPCCSFLLNIFILVLCLIPTLLFVICFCISLIACIRFHLVTTVRMSKVIC